MIMKAKGRSLLSALHVLSLGFFCGLVSIPLMSILLRALSLYFRKKRKTFRPSLALYPHVRTERGKIVHVIPQSLEEKERERELVSL